LRLAEARNLGDWKSVGGEVSEMRVAFAQAAIELHGDG
jgi:putative component of toxin-antitoxin plasmid stabilization module